jgi:hypothetical protein
MASRLLAPVRGWEARRALRTARRRADEEILSTRFASPRLAWRVQELLADENRIDLGRSVTNVVHAADERLLPGAAPVDRAAVRACRAQLLELAALLCDTAHEVTPRGVLLSERLLVDSSSPLFGRRDPGQLLREITRVKAVLDGTQ